MTIRPADWILLVVLALDAVLLALLEMLFLPLYLGQVQFPVTVVVAAVTTPLLVGQAARLGNRWFAMVPLAAWILTLLVVGVQGPGGDAVLRADWRAFLLLVAGALPAAFVLGKRTVSRG